MILDEIQALLVADPGVSALAGPRIYDTVLPRGSVLPAVVYHTVTAPSSYTMRGTSSPDDITVQLDVYASTAPAVRALRDALEDVLQDFRGTLSGGSVVQATFWLFDMDMPYTPAINQTAIGFRVMSHVRFVYVGAAD